jgi:hypothetical protein
MPKSVNAILGRRYRHGPRLSNRSSGSQPLQDRRWPLRRGIPVCGSGLAAIGGESSLTLTVMAVALPRAIYRYRRRLCV